MNEENSHRRLLLINALRRTLKRLEDVAGSADDPVLLELKSSILRAIAEHASKQASDQSEVNSTDDSEYIN